MQTTQTSDCLHIYVLNMWQKNFKQHLSANILNYFTRLDVGAPFNFYFFYYKYRQQQLETLTPLTSWLTNLDLVIAEKAVTTAELDYPTFCSGHGRLLLGFQPTEVTGGVLWRPKNCQGNIKKPTGEDTPSKSTSTMCLNNIIHKGALYKDTIPKLMLLLGRDYVPSQDDPTEAPGRWTSSRRPLVKLKQGKST